MTDWQIALTPRQRATYDALWSLTSGGKHPWTGVLRAGALTVEQVNADARGLREMGVIGWERVRKLRRYEVLVTPSRLDAKPPRRDFGSKLKDEPEIEHGLPVGRPPSGPPRTFTVDADQSHFGCRLDNGAFSRAFEAAFPGRDYKGLRPAQG